MPRILRLPKGVDLAHYYLDKPRIDISGINVNLSIHMNDKCRMKMTIFLALFAEEMGFQGKVKAKS
jgi:hypothetical protein